MLQGTWWLGQGTGGPGLRLCHICCASAHVVYSLVKHGGVRNYVAVAWSPEDLAACADLNLPCADVSGLLLEPICERPLQRMGPACLLALGWRHDGWPRQEAPSCSSVCQSSTPCVCYKHS